MTFENVVAAIITILIFIFVLSELPSQHMKSVEAEETSCVSRTVSPRIKVERHIGSKKVSEKMLVEKKERVISSINEGLHMIDMELDRNAEHF